MDNEPIIPPPSPGRRCIAFDHSPAADDLWTRCMLRSLPGDRLCRIHRDAIDGVMIGLVDYEKSNELVYDLTAKPETGCIRGANSPEAQREAETSAGKCAAQAGA